MIFGYCRISTDRQNIERQIRNIKKAYPDAIIKQEVYTGTKTDGRKVFEQLFEKADIKVVMCRGTDWDISYLEDYLNLPLPYNKEIRAIPRKCG